VEAADAHVDRVDGAAADRGEDLIAGLQRQAPLDHGAVVLGHVDGAGVAEEVRRVQQVDVQGVAGDPLAAVQQAAQVRKRAVDRDPAGVFDRLAGAHLVGDGADAADACGQIGWLGVAAAAQQRLEEAGWLVDA
jgi:hypothetical protein